MIHNNTLFNSGAEVNPTQIRIWIHEKLLSSLEHVVFEGHGHLLLGQSTSNSKIKRFLDSVPKLMVRAVTHLLG